jgi:hypothetical protein
MTFGTDQFWFRALFRKRKFEVDQRSGWRYDTPVLATSEEL